MAQKPFFRVFGPQNKGFGHIGIAVFSKPIPICRYIGIGIGHIGSIPNTSIYH